MDTFDKYSVIHIIYRGEIVESEKVMRKGKKVCGHGMSELEREKMVE